MARLTEDVIRSQKISCRPQCVGVDWLNLGGEVISSLSHKFPSWAKWLNDTHVTEL